MTGRRVETGETPARIVTILLWILFGGTMLIYDSHLRFACRDAKEIYQLVLVSLITGLHLWRTGSHKPLGIRNGPVDWLVLLTLGASLYAFWITPVHLHALPRFVNLVVYLLFFLALRDIFEKHADPFHYLVFFLAAAFISSIYAVLQYAGIDPIFEPKLSFDERRWVVAGFMGQQTLFAGIIGPLVPMGFTLAVRARTGLGRSILVSTSLLIIIATILTHTRAVLAGYVVAMILAVCLLSITSNWKLLRAVLLVSAVIAAIFVSSYASIPTFQKRISQGFTLESASIRARMHYWRCSAELIREKPWRGWGLGSFMKYYPEAQIRVRTQNTGFQHHGTEVVSHPHNELILAWIEGGIPLLASVLLLTAAVTLHGLKRFLFNRRTPERLLDLGCLLALTILLVNALFSFPMHIGPSALLTVVFAAYMCRHYVNPDRAADPRTGGPH